MIRMHNIPKQIQEALRPYYKDGEKPDVFPSKFQINNQLYYYFTFAPAAEQLIMRDDGIVPSFHEIRDVALICNSYNVSIETIASIGKKWVESGKKKNYEKLRTILRDAQKALAPLPPDVEAAFQSYLRAADEIIDLQNAVQEAVDDAIIIWDRTNLQELATQQDQIDMRACIVKMSRATYKQNEIQLQTEKDREKVWEFVSSKRWPFKMSGWSFYVKLRPYQKNMMKNTPLNMREAEEVGRMVLSEDLPLEQHDNANDVWQHLRNPR
ncbi:hypothetical protein [Bacillus dakarensis]|uniref:hypothetical protein n=1 Tax=Robertmurraya dakarensis TaxID=1926278 RepID=UPI0009817AF0|nr:hypothetical protein [Bacillus dakarensis]